METSITVAEINRMSEDWKQESLNKVDKAMKKGNFMRPKFSGFLTKSNIEALKKAKELLIEQERKKNGAGRKAENFRSPD